MIIRKHHQASDVAVERADAPLARHRELADSKTRDVRLGGAFVSGGGLHGFSSS